MRPAAKATGFGLFMINVISGLGGPPIEVAASVLDPMQVFDYPGSERLDRHKHFRAQFRQRVFDAWGFRRVHGAPYETVPLQAAQCKREHLLRDAVYRSPEHAKALRTLLQLHDDENRPFVSHAR